MKPIINPATVRTALSLLGTVIAAIAVIPQFTWQTVLAAVGGAVFGWMRTAPNHIAIDELPLDVRESVKPPPASQS
jgi:hypothetical protein